MGVRPATAPGRARAVSPLPTATWRAFNDTIQAWRDSAAGRPPAVINVTHVPRGGSGGRQVIQTMRCLGFVDEDHGPTVALYRLLRGDRGVVLDELRSRWPRLIQTVESPQVPAARLELAFIAAAQGATPDARWRFRCFVLMAYKAAGNPGATLPTGRRSPPVRSRGSNSAKSEDRNFVRAQLRRQIDGYTLLFEAACADGHLRTAREISAEIDNLRVQLLDL